MQVENLLSDLVRIQSVNPPGNEGEIAHYLKNLFDAHDISNEIIESSPGRCSFLAYLGEGDRGLLYLSHLDVVPVSDGWDFEPFSGEIKDGFVHGRGSSDCKGRVAAEAFAMINLARTGKLGGRLIFAATADEETGGELGVKYILEKHRNKLKVDFAINEGGWAPLDGGDKSCWFIGVGEKGGNKVKLISHGVPAHGATPMMGKNAVVMMAEVVKGLASYRPEIILIPEVREMLKEISRLYDWNDEITEINVDRLITKVVDRQFAAMLSSVTRMTVSPMTINGGTFGIVPDRCEVETGITVLPGQDQSYVFGELKDIIGETEIKWPRFQQSTISTTTNGYYGLIKDTLGTFIGDVLIAPFILHAPSDSRYLREAGIPSYGLPSWSASNGVHGINEKNPIDNVRGQSELLKLIAQKYLGFVAN